MAQAAYCSQCKANVYVTEDGRCPNGHGPESLSGHYDVPEAPAVDAPAPAVDAPAVDAPAPAVAAEAPTPADVAVAEAAYAPKKS